MNKAVIFNIQKYCIHDGPGIRTTIFFKGCPLTCIWCHNPESQRYEKELLFHGEKCTGCGDCGKRCPSGAAGPTGNMERCIACGICTDNCPADARSIAGKEYSLTELMTEIEKDRPFYEQSGGGVTLSGGEALCQPGFVAELAKVCNGRDIRVAIDTCGYVPFESIIPVLDYTEIFLFDLKFADGERHRKYTGQDNELIVANVERLCRSGARVNLRIPLIEGINADPDNIEGIIARIQFLNIAAVNLLPYHDIGRDKYRRLGRKYQVDATPPTAARLEEIRQRFMEGGFTVKIGG